MLDCKRAMVLSSADGMDEISISSILMRLYWKMENKLI